MPISSFTALTSERISADVASMLGSQDGVLEPKHCSPRLGHPAPHEVSQELHDRQQEGDVGIKCRVKTPWSCNLGRVNLAYCNLLPGVVEIDGIGGLCPPGEDGGGDFGPSRGLGGCQEGAP